MMDGLQGGLLPPTAYPPLPSPPTAEKCVLFGRLVVAFCRIPATTTPCLVSALLRPDVAQGASPPLKSPALPHIHSAKSREILALVKLDQLASLPAARPAI